MVHLGGQTAFFVEPLDVVGFLDEFFGQDLDGDGAIQRELFGLIDDGHRAGTEFAHDLITGDLAGSVAAFVDVCLEPLQLTGSDVLTID